MWLGWCSLAVFVLATQANLLRARGPEQQAAPQEPAAAKQPAVPQDKAAAEQPARPQPKVSPEQQAAAEKQGLPVVVTNSIGLQLVLIPAGEFQMGSPATEEGRVVMSSNIGYGSPSPFTWACTR